MNLRDDVIWAPDITHTGSLMGTGNIVQFYLFLEATLIFVSSRLSVDQIYLLICLMLKTKF